jgi:ATP-dependent RNA helicase DOB1
MFTGIFNDLSVEQCCSLLSCMTFDEINKDEGDPASGMKSFLSAPFYKLQEVARTVAKVEISCGIAIDEEEFVEKFNPGM